MLSWRSLHLCTESISHQNTSERKINLSSVLFGSVSKTTHTMWAVHRVSSFCLECTMELNGEWAKPLFVIWGYMDILFLFSFLFSWLCVSFRGIALFHAFNLIFYKCGLSCSHFIATISTFLAFAFKEILKFARLPVGTSN